MPGSRLEAAYGAASCENTLLVDEVDFGIMQMRIPQLLLQLMERRSELVGEAAMAIGLFRLRHGRQGTAAMAVRGRGEQQPQKRRYVQAGVRYRRVARSPGVNEGNGANTGWDFAGQPVYDVVLLRKAERYRGGWGTTARSRRGVVIHQRKAGNRAEGSRPAGARAVEPRVSRQRQAEPPDTRPSLGSRTSRGLPI